MLCVDFLPLHVQQWIDQNDCQGGNYKQVCHIQTLFQPGHFSVQRLQSPFDSLTSQKQLIAICNCHNPYTPKSRRLQYWKTKNSRISVLVLSFFNQNLFVVTRPNVFGSVNYYTDGFYDEKYSKRD
jgi:hypothetical protein